VANIAWTPQVTRRIMSCCVRAVYATCVVMCRGHGTHVEDTQLCASVAGVVERVNRLVSVHPYKLRSVSQFSVAMPYLCVIMIIMISTIIMLSVKKGHHFNITNTGPNRK